MTENVSKHRKALIFRYLPLFFSILLNLCKKQERKSKVKSRCFVAIGLAIPKPVFFCSSVKIGESNPNGVSELLTFHDS